MVMLGRMIVAIGAVALMGTLAHGAVLNIGNGPDPGSLDPHKATGVWEDRIISELFEGLVVDGPDALAVPGAAESWTVSDDRLVYVFTLRADARWSDGEPVLAQQFVDGFWRLFDPTTASEYAYLQFYVRNAAAVAAGELPPHALGVRAIDDRTIEITLEAPTPYFIEALAHYTALPIRAELIETWGADWTHPDHFVGNGPYRLVEWVPGSYIRAVRSETFHDSASVAVDTVNWINTEDLAAGLNRYRAGEIDWLTEFPADQYALIADKRPGEAHVQPYLGSYYFEVNSETAPLSDRRVREALSISLERELFGPEILGTGELPAYGWVPPGVANYSGATYVPAWANEPIEGRRETARALLAAAGYGPDRPLKLRLRYFTNDNSENIMVAVQSMWAEIGVETELFGSEVVAHFDALAAGDFEIGMSGWGLDYNDASNVLDLLRGPTENADGTVNWGNNHGRFADKRFDELMDTAAATADLTARAAILHEAEELAMDAYAAIPLYWPVGKNLVARNVRGYQDNVEDIHRVRWMTINE